MSKSMVNSARPLQEPRPPQGTRAINSANGPRSHSNINNNGNTNISHSNSMQLAPTSTLFGGGGGGAAADGSGEQQPRPKINLRPLTKLEQQRMDTIPQRQKENRHSPQIVKGKEYQGSGFAATPSVVRFIDFELGKEYKQTIKLTNVSYSFNGFKVEALPINLRAILDVVYVPQSRMVAGRDCTIDVIFTPRENIDIASFITITTMTGVMELPIECRRKRSDVTIVNGVNEMDFGQVVIGESCSRSITFKNHGALPAAMAVEGDAVGLFSIEHALVANDGNAAAAPGTAADGTMLESAGTMGWNNNGGAADGGLITNPPATAEGGQHRLSTAALSDFNGNGGVTITNLQSLPRPGTAATDASVNTDVAASLRAATAVSRAAGGGTAASTKKVFTSVPDFSGVISSGKAPMIVLAPFSEQTFTVTFAPRETCHFETSFFFSFESADVDDKVVFVRGEATALPIFISENRRINLQCAFFDTLYRDSFTVSNTSSSAAKVTPMVPPLLRDALEFVPKFGYVQAGATLTFQVKFTPETSFSSAYLTSRDGSVVFDQSIRVVVSDQNLPLYLSLVGRLSHNSIRFTQPPSGELRLGNVYTHETIETQVVLTNKANIARRVGFVNLPANVEVRSPPIPVFSILPGESMPITLAIKAPNGTVGQFTQILRMMTEHADGCSLTITGQGRTAAVELSPSFVAFPPTAAGAASEAHAVLISKSPVAQDFTFLSLARHGVTVQPSRGTIHPNQQIPVVLTFRADPDVIDLKLPPPIREEDFIQSIANAAAAVDAPNATTGAGTGRSSVSDKAGSSSVPPKPASSNKKKNKLDDEAERLERLKEVEQRKAAFERLQRARDDEVVMIRKLIPWESSAPNEPWALHRELVIPCSIRPTPTSSAFDEVAAAKGGASAGTSNADAASSLTSPNGGASSSTSSAAAPPRVAKPLFITTRCCVVKPVATIEPLLGPNAQRLSSTTDKTTSNGAAATAAATAGGGGIAAASGKSASAKQQQGSGALLGAANSNTNGNMSRVPSNLKDAAKKKGGASAADNDSLPSATAMGGAGGAAGFVSGDRKDGDDDAATITPTTTLDFGNIPSQHAVTKSLVVRHTSTIPNTIMRLYAQPLDPFGVFTVTRPPQAVLRSLGDSTEVTIKFQPTHEALYEQTVRIMCETVAMDPHDIELVSPLGGVNGALLSTSIVSAAPSSIAAMQASTTGGATTVAGGAASSMNVLSRHFIVAHLTGRGQPAALTITKSTTAAASGGGATGVAGGGSGPNGAGLAGAGKAGAAGAGSNSASPSKPGAGGPNAAAGGAGGLNPSSASGGALNNSSNGGGAFSDLATAHEKLDQLNKGLRGIATCLTVDMGTCVAGDVLEQFYDFTNCSEFPLTVKTEVTKILNRNPNHVCPFTVTPPVVTIPPRVSVPICLSFNPTVAGIFSALAKVQFGGEDSYHDINLSGRATDKGLYVITPSNLKADAVKGSNPVNESLFGAGGAAATAAAAFAPFGEDSSSPNGLPPLPTATTGLATRRDGLSALLSLLPSSAVPAPGSSATHPLALSFAATATRTFDADGTTLNRDPSTMGASRGASDKEKRAEEKRLKKELAAAAAAAAKNTSGNDGSNSGRKQQLTPRALAQQQAKKEDDGPGLSCTVVSTTATHQIVIGNNHSSTHGEYLVEGLTDVDASYGWKVAVTCVAYEEGSGLASGANTVGAGAMGGGAGGGGGMGMGAGGANNTSISGIGNTSPSSPSRGEGKAGGAAPIASAMAAVPGALPPIRGSLIPGQAALVSITFTPKQALLESLPLDEVDIVAVADIRVTTRGGMPATAPEGRVLHLQLKGVVKNSK